MAAVTCRRHLQTMNTGCTVKVFSQVRTMYAILQVGGRQVKVTPGAVALVEGTQDRPVRS